MLQICFATKPSASFAVPK